MFNQIFDAIEEWMRELLTGMISSNLDRMFTDVNQKTSEIAGQVGQTPQGWNGSIFSMIEGLSNSVIMPIAGIIITFVLCYELISMLTERNNMHDIDTWMFFKYFVKMWIAVYLVSNTFTITMAVFDVGQNVVNSAAGLVSGDTSIDISSLPLYLSCTDPIRNDEQQRVGTDRNELFQRTLCPGIPGISDDGMCCYLCSISGRHPVFR